MIRVVLLVDGAATSGAHNARQRLSSSLRSPRNHNNMRRNAYFVMSSGRNSPLTTTTTTLQQQPFSASQARRRELEEENVLSSTQRKNGCYRQGTRRNYDQRSSVFFRPTTTLASSSSSSFTNGGSFLLSHQQQRTTTTPQSQYYPPAVMHVTTAATMLSSPMMSRAPLPPPDLLQQQQQHRESMRVFMEALLASQSLVPQQPLKHKQQQQQPSVSSPLPLHPMWNQQHSTSTRTMISPRAVNQAAVEASLSSSISLQPAAAALYTQNALAVQPLEEEESVAARDDHQVVEDVVKRTKDEQQQQDHTADATSPAPTNKREYVLSRQARRLTMELTECMYNRPHPDRALDVYYRSMERFDDNSNDDSMQPRILADSLRSALIRSLFFMMLQDKRPVDAYRIFKHYIRVHTREQREKQQHAARGEGDQYDENLLQWDMNDHVEMLKRAVDVLRYLDPRKHPHELLERLADAVIQDVKQLNREGQEQTLPILVSALAQQNAVSLGLRVPALYHYMMEQQFVVSPGYWEHLLSLSKFFRQDDLPYAQIFQRAIQAGRRPDPDLVLKALDHLYPFADHRLVDAHVFLSGILELQRQEPPSPSSSTKQHRRSDHYEYMVDVATLEHIGSVAAGRGSSELCLLVWDVMDAMGYEPTEAMYENTVMAFFTREETYGDAFAVMRDMEDRGYIPSRALIRGVSTFLRNSSHLGVAMEQVESMQLRGTAITVSMLNAIMSGYAERGDVDRVWSLLEEYDRFGVQPNADSFGFAFEALGKRVRSASYSSSSSSFRRMDKEHFQQMILDRADGLLNDMESRGIRPTRHIIREYVALLCQTNQYDIATNVVLEAKASSSDGGSQVCNKTIYLVAMHHVEKRDYDMARHLASLMTEPFPLLENHLRQQHELDML